MARFFRISQCGIVAILAAMSVTVLYAAASWNNQFVYDDHEVIENQYPIHSVADAIQIFREPHYLNFPYYRPITRLTLALQKTIWGDSPRPFHLFNAMLAGALLLSTVALLRRPCFAITPSAALITAIWFALHPAVSECVYPAASGRETLLPALFIVLSIWAYLRPDWIGYSWAILLFAVALLCKEQAAVIPGLFFLADILGLAGRKKWWLGYAPILAIIAGYFFARHLIFHGSSLHLNIQSDPAGPAWAMLYGLQTAVTPFWRLHYEPTRQVWFDPALSGVAFIVLGILIVLIGKCSRPVKLASLFWLGWFILLQLPTAHIFLQEAPFSERYAAMAILGFGATVAAVAGDRLQRPISRKIAAAAALIVAGIFGWFSFLRGSYYIDDTSFCIGWVESDANSPGAHRGLGYIAQEQHDYPTAIREYQETLLLDPNDRSARNNVANLLAAQGRWIEARQQFDFLLREDPSDAEVMVNDAKMLEQEAFQRRDASLLNQARNLLDRAIQLRQRYAPAHYALGLWYQSVGARNLAIEEFRTCLQLRPDWPDAQTHLQQVLALPTTSP
ncbi:MAG: tetratricopeptide repeat protein [Tepidisphaeraceae bacterium]|jgi:Flp pilus assembly protein TadD